MVCVSRSRRAERLSRTALVAAFFALGTLGCVSTWETLGAAVAYERAPLADDRVQLDVPYRMDSAADPEKHALDFFLPVDAAPGWPTLVFVHGGGWTSGDRATGLFGIEPYRNIGRFYAARGYGVVVPSYRLQPDVDWRAQVDDVAAAVAWARENVARHGGDPGRIHLSGHSAGAWLAAWVGLDDASLAARGETRDFVCSLVLVSGAGYDPEDEETYALGASRRYFERRFTAASASALGAPPTPQGDSTAAPHTGDWAMTASIRRAIDAPVPPALVLNAEGEAPTFERQADLLFDTLEARSPASRRATMPGLDHQRIVIELSREGSPVSDAALDFLGSTDCGGGRGA